MCKVCQTIPWQVTAVAHTAHTILYTLDDLYYSDVADGRESGRQGALLATASSVITQTTVDGTLVGQKSGSGVKKESNFLLVFFITNNTPTLFLFSRF
jgi:hypothetical protein